MLYLHLYAGSCQISAKITLYLVISLHFSKGAQFQNSLKSVCTVWHEMGTGCVFLVSESRNQIVTSARIIDFIS
jgi:hypothetical protein